MSAYIAKRTNVEAFNAPKTKASALLKSCKSGNKNETTFTVSESLPPSEITVSAIVKINTHIKETAVENKNDFDKLHISAEIDAHIQSFSL